ncbi:MULTISPECIES: hypothetical protein [Xenorhabdus]|uniref:hypothetical protein n=1 Tax=Xenorhabdus TaxID=626 RepID=UPI000648F8D7|nr:MULTISPECIES: hypothetical protein [Xenorhabdus]
MRVEIYIVAWISKADSVDEERINQEDYAEEIEPEGMEFNINYYFFLCFKRYDYWNKLAGNIS